MSQFNDSPLYDMSNQGSQYYSTPDLTSSNNNTSQNWQNFGVDLANTVVASLSGVGKRKREKEAREHQIKMYEMQRADQRAMIDEQNRYNSPSEQLKRLRQAGLNEHLMYGKGVTATQPAAGTPPPMTQVNPLSSPLEFLSQAKFLELQLLKEEVRGKKISNDITEKTSADTIESARLSRIALDKNNDLIDRAITSGDYDNALKSLEYEVRSNEDYGMKKVSAIQYALLEFDKKYKDSTYKINVDHLQTLLDTAKVDKQIKDELLKVSTIHSDMWDKGISPNDSAFERSLAASLQSLLDDNSDIGRAIYGTLEKLPFGKILLPLLKLK